MTETSYTKSTAGEPKPSPLSPAPYDDPLSAEQWRTLFAIADALIPTIAPPGGIVDTGTNLVVTSDQYSNAAKAIRKHGDPSIDNDLVAAYLEERPSQNALFRENIYRTVTLYIPADQFSKLSIGLSLLNYRISSLAFTRSITPFADQTIRSRQEVLLSWSQSSLAPLRVLFKSFSLLVKQTYGKSSSILHQVLGFPRVPVHGTPGKSFDYAFVELPPGPASEPEVIEVDAIVVGSGCGAGVIAKNLADANIKVLVVDKSYHWPADHLPMTESQGFPQLYVNGGIISSDDGSMSVIAGQTWGGGGTVNWSASLQPQDFVRKEWSEKFGLPLFTSQTFQDCLDTVCGRMGVSSEHVEHNKNNRILLEGARRLGMTAKVVPQNTGGKRHYCGYCTMGCSSCEKQGPAVSFLPDAASNGARFMEGFDVEKVTFETNAKGRKVATGVVGVWTSRDEHGGVSGTRYQRRVVVKAKKVIVSGGSMQSPVILQKSGLTNKHIGRHLKLHPVCVIGAIYDEEIRPWEGGILTAVVSSLENMDQQGHGVKLEASTMLPSLFLPATAWRGGLEWKLLAPKFRSMSGHISLCRDTGSGNVYPDPQDGRPRFHYNANKRDREHILAGMLALAKINYIEGAREIFSTSHSIPHFVRQDAAASEPDGAATGINDKLFSEWLHKLEAFGLPDPDSFFVSAHQMGSCRMAASPAKGVVDMYGRVWEADNLYVADASVFPSASGVNPMVTNMGISQWIGSNLAADWRSDRTERGKL